MSSQNSDSYGLSAIPSTMIPESWDIDIHTIQVIIIVLVYPPEHWGK